MDALNNGDVNYYIAIAGNIGVGKTTLTNMLSDRLGWQPILEAFEENPFLADFYKDMPRWGFHSQIFFLTQRLKQHHFLTQRVGSIVQDRSIYEDAEIFARNLHIQGNLADHEWNTYYDLYRTITRVIAPPNLMVYLKANNDTLLQRINHRGRDYEQGISIDYLGHLNDRYNEWITNFKLCPTLIIETDPLDFVLHQEHLDLILNMIDQKLAGQDLIAI